MYKEIKLWLSQENKAKKKKKKLQHQGDFWKDWKIFEVKFNKWQLREQAHAHGRIFTQALTQLQLNLDSVKRLCDPWSLPS